MQVGTHNFTGHKKKIFKFKFRYTYISYKNGNITFCLS